MKRNSMIDRSLFRWPGGQRAAITLSYDDCLAVHHREVAPLLEYCGLRATFNIAPNCNGFADQLDGWRKVAAAGHELGNHTLFHPCRDVDGNKARWLSRDYNLCNYSPERWLHEVRMANLILHLVDGQTERTFANTCCDNALGIGPSIVCLETLIAQLFPAARGEFLRRAVDIEHPQFTALGHFGADGRTFAALHAEIEGIIAAGNWGIYMIHGVGRGTHASNIDTAEHRQLVEYLAANRERIWTAPMLNVVRHLKACAST